VRFFDTTLRDGEQMPGISLTVEEKVQIGMALDELKVDYIEAGFAAVSPEEAEAVRRIARDAAYAEVASLARANKADIDAAVDADVDMVHVFIATSDIHMKYKLRMTRDEVLRRITESVEYAKSRGVRVLFSAEDATRSDLGFLVEAFRTAIEAGADEINVPDTVGVMTPSRMRYLVGHLKAELPPVPMHVHCHDDFGMAVANTIAAIEAGAEVAQVTVNGFGERGGNAALEEVAAAARFLLGREVGLRMERLYETSRLVARLFGIQLQPNKAVVGDNAFSHESGIHVHGVLNNPFTYEPMMPEAVGNRRRIVLGKHSGRHSVEWALKQMGLEPSPELVDYILRRVKDYAARKRPVDEKAIKAFVEEFRGVPVFL
jgi:2-isopropylmalate synthase